MLRLLSLSSGAGICRRGRSADRAAQDHARPHPALEAGDRGLGLFRRRHSAGAAHQVRADGAHRHRLARRHQHPEDPVEFFGQAGIQREEMLQDALDIRAKVNRPRGGSAHILTGPIYIDEAEPGDMLEVRIIDLEHRVPYGVNSSGPRVGVLPDLLKAPVPQGDPVRCEAQRGAVLAGDRDSAAAVHGHHGGGAHQGILDDLVAAALALGRQHGLQQARRGATLYLPVFHDGAQFFTGDSHAVQGDGEVNGTAIEASLTGTFQFIVHKGGAKAMYWPRAEDAE